MLRGRVILGALTIFAVIVSAIVACGQAATGVDACQSIENARCQWIVQCFADSGNYGLPTPRKDQTGQSGTTQSPVDDCMRYYSDACLHGLVSNVQPTQDQVNACVTAINGATDCNIVIAPETADACAFLTYDAGLDAAAD